MRCLTRVHEECRRPGARQGGRNLVPDVTGFAHAADHDPAAAAEHQPARLDKGVVDAWAQRAQRFAFRVDDRQGQRFELVGIHARRNGLAGGLHEQ